MTDTELAKMAESTWNYAKSIGSPINPNFEQWFRTRASKLYALNDDEVSRVWLAAIRMHS